MNWFNFNFRKILNIAFLLGLPFVAINVQQKPSTTPWFNKPFSFIASTSQWAFFSMSESVRGSTSLYINLINIKRENSKLKKETEELKARLQLMDDLERENSRLNALFDFKQKTKMDLIASRVISRDLLTDHNTLLINKGTHHGLKSGQAVITIGGVVGYIFRPEAFSSQVLLITDRYAVVDGIINRSRARGIVEGKSQSTCALRYVEKSEDVKVGDLVITSGLDNIFPKGFPIAVVDNVENKTYAVSLKVDLKPVIDPNKIEEVFVILNAANEEFVDFSSQSTEFRPKAL